jgi:hypothetical protein
MHPPVHRLLGWVSRPSAFGSRRLVWRLNQLRGLAELEAMVKGEPADTDLETVERLPTLFQATVLGKRDQPLGTVVDAAVDLGSGAIRHYLVSRSDPRLPGSSRWRLSPDRIDDQQPGRVFARLEELDDLPLARASVRQEFLRRSRRWRDQVQEAGSRIEERLEGWLEEPPWESEPRPDRQERPESRPADQANDWDNWPEPVDPDPRSRRSASQPNDEDPWF